LEKKINENKKIKREVGKKKRKSAKKREKKKRGMDCGLLL
jgi:hypothetical protein